MEQEPSKMELIYWKKQLGEPLDPEEEKLWEEWEKLRSRPKSWEQVENHLFRTARVRRLKENTRMAIRATLNLQDEIVSPVTVAEPRPGITRNINWGVAAAAAAVLTAGVWWFTRPSAHLPHPPLPAPQVANSLKEFRPPTLAGVVAVTLLTHDHKKYELGLAAGKQLVFQDDSTTIRTHGDSIIFTSLLSSRALEDSLNTIVVPAGKQAWVVLPDGSTVCLNANSSFQFPAKFNDTLREVAMTGDAFYHVNSNTHWPFTVYAAGSQVQATGTFFNVDVNEATNDQYVTLFDGVIHVSRDTHSLTIRSPQTVRILTNDIVEQSQDQQDVQEVANRQSPDFNYQKAKVSTMIKDIAKWYGLTIINPEMLKRMDYEARFGPLSKSSPMRSVIKAIELQGIVKLEVNGNKMSIIRIK